MNLSSNHASNTQRRCYKEGWGCHTYNNLQCLVKPATCTGPTCVCRLTRSSRCSAYTTNCVVVDCSQSLSTQTLMPDCPSAPQRRRRPYTALCLLPLACDTWSLADPPASTLPPETEPAGPAAYESPYSYLPSLSFLEDAVLAHVWRHNAQLQTHHLYVVDTGQDPLTRQPRLPTLSAVEPAQYRSGLAVEKSLGWEHSQQRLLELFRKLGCQPAHTCNHVCALVWWKPDMR